MNIQFARTFLEIAQSGNFNKAAERLHVTQSTVTMRIKTLEESLGQPLFIRNKAGAQLTAAGIQFQRYAETLVRTWQQARQELALPSEFRAALAIGAQFSLWDGLLDQWLPTLRRMMTDVALRIEVGDIGTLMRQLREGLLDITVMYQPQSRSGLTVERLFDEQLILVSHEPRALVRWDPRYVYIDWGPEFHEAHSRAYPVDETPVVTFGLGALGLDYILKNGGSGYFPLRIVRDLLDRQQLFLIQGAPKFMRPVYVAYSATTSRWDWFTTALQGLRDLGIDCDKAGQQNGAGDQVQTAAPPGKTISASSRSKRR